MKNYPSPDKRKAIFMAKKLFAEAVYDMAALEDLPFTFPEVQTILDGITVGGRKIEDHLIIGCMADAWKTVIGAVQTDGWRVNKLMACELNGIVAKYDSLEPGAFRTGQVTISGTSYLPPPAEELPERFQDALDAFRGEKDVYERSFKLFLNIARSQYFWDGNKRTGRLLMCGELMSAGYPPVSVPAVRKLEFNEKMIRFYESGDTGEMLDFLFSMAGLKA